MKNLFYLIFITITLLNCGKPCIESRGIEGAGLVITFFHVANNEYFYPENIITYPTSYKLDSLKIKDSQGHSLETIAQINSDPINPLKGINVISVYPIFIPNSDQAAYSSEQTKNIYIKYNYNTYDTLKLIYKATKEKCANKYDYVRAYYKNVLISELNNSYSQALVFTIKH